MNTIIDLSATASAWDRVALLLEATALAIREADKSSQNSLPLFAPPSKGRVDEPEKPVTTTIEPKPKKALALLLDASEMAALLGCDKRTLRRWELARKIPKSVTIGGSKRWRRSTVEQWLEDKR